MKAKLFTASILLLFYASGCHVDNAKVVETEKQTLECLVGNWIPENTDESMNKIAFDAPTTAEEKSGTVTATGGVEPMSGTWQYKSVGEVDVLHTDGISHFKLLNCKRGIVNGLTIYIKE